MRTTVPCPVCQHTLTFIAIASELACPFCRATIKFRDGKIPVGKRVRCSRCRGAFTAESPPQRIRVFASRPQACPFCGVSLAIRDDLPAGKKVRCFKCRKKFYPRHNEDAGAVAAAPVAEAPIQPIASAKSVERKPAPLVARKPASKTRVVISNGSSRSGLTHLAPDPARITAPVDVGMSVDGADNDLVDFFGIDRGAARPSETPPPLAPDGAFASPRSDAAESPEPRAPHRSSTTTVAETAPLLAASTAEKSRRRASAGAVAEPASTEPGEPIEAFDSVAEAIEADAFVETEKTHSEEEAVEVEEVIEAFDAAEEVSDDDQPLAGESVEQEQVEVDPEESVDVDERELVVQDPVEPEEQDSVEEREADDELEPIEEHPAGEDQGAIDIEETEHASPVPLSSNSLECEASLALLATNDEATDTAFEVDSPEVVEERSDSAAVAKPPPPPPSVSRPAAPPPKKPTFPQGPGLTINWTKVLAFTIPILLVGAGVYFFFSKAGTGKQKVIPTEGIVLFQGAPATGARVTLYPEVKTRSRYFPTGKVGADGTFKLTTYEPDDGAPAGRYKVTIVRGQIEQEEYAELSKKYTPEEVQKISEKMAQDPLATKYCTPRESGLTAVVPDDGKLTFNLD